MFSCEFFNAKTISNERTDYLMYMRGSKTLAFPHIRRY